MNTDLPFDKLKKKNPKILLIHPSFKYVGTDRFPLGLGYIASHMKKYSNNILVYDEQKYEIGITQLQQIKPDIVGISATTPSYKRVKKLLKSIHRLTENLRPLILMGGTHATFLPDQTLHDGVDIILRGEADDTIHQLFEIDEFSELLNIPGISFKENLTNQHNPILPQVKDLDMVPFPSRELFDRSMYPVMSITTSRGCPYTCAYCSATEFWGRKVRFHSVEYVETELEQIADLGYKFVCFEDATFSVKYDRTKAICATLINNPKLKNLAWSCETRPDCVNPDILNVFEESRCCLLMLGVESASKHVLKINKRTVSIKNLYKGMEQIMETNIPLQVLMIFGLPGETEESVNETIEFYKHFKPDRILLSLATAYPGTELMQETRRVEMDTDFIRRFTGHGENSPLYLPESMDKNSYKYLAEKMLEVTLEINKENQNRFREKQNSIINNRNLTFQY